jgi:hypothetical protein
VGQLLDAVRADQLVHAIPDLVRGRPVHPEQAAADQGLQPAQDVAPAGPGWQGVDGGQARPPSKTQRCRKSALAAG